MAKKRDTPRKHAILRMLEANWGDEYADYGDPGPPPYTATRIAEYVDSFGGDNGRVWNVMPDGTKTYQGIWSPSAMTVQSFARTLRAMAAEGLLIQVKARVSTRNAMGDDDYADMWRVAYYSVAAYERNKREEQFGKLQCHEVAQNKEPGRVIEGDYIREVSGASDTASAATADPEYIPF